MGKKSGPPAPDYTAAAEKQSQASQQLALQDTYANRPTMNTPWGRQTWSQTAGVDPATGKPITNWTQNIELSPAEQASEEAQQRISMGRSQGAEQLVGQANQNFQTPMDWNNLPGRAQNVNSTAFMFGRGPQQQNYQTSLNGDSGDYRQRAQDAVDQLNQPALDQRRASMTNQLANQGLTPGSEAYTNAMRDVGDSENRAHLQAIDSGRAEAAQSFGQDLSAGQFGNQGRSMQFGDSLQANQFQNQTRNQDINERIAAGNFNNNNRQSAIQEQMARRGQTLNELNALLSGQQVSMPQFAQFNQATMGQAPQYNQAAQNQYSAALDSNNARNAFSGQLFGAAGQAAGAAMMFSDERLKTEIETVGYSPGGARVVHYRYRGLPGRYVGVIAQEVAKVFPKAVVPHPSGYLMVNYAEIH